MSYEIPYIWDEEAERYRWGPGTGLNGFVSYEDVLAYTDEYTDREGVNLIGLVGPLLAGSISLLGFQKEAADTLRRLHVGSAILGADGIENMKRDDWAMVQGQLKRQFYAGVDPKTKRKFGLKHLSDEVVAGEVSAAKLRQRLALYARSGRLTAGEMRKRVAKRRGFNYGYRELTPGHKHCPECIYYASLDPVPLHQLVPKGVGCRCQNNCVCRIFYVRKPVKAKRHRRRKDELEPITLNLVSEHLTQLLESAA